MEMNLYRNSSRWLQSQALLSVHIIAFSCGQHTHNYAKHMECACPDLSICVCVCALAWPSAVSCCVLRVSGQKVFDYTHTHAYRDSGGEREEKRRSKSDPRIQFGWRRRLNQTWQHSDRTCEGLASHCFGLDLERTQRQCDATRHDTTRHEHRLSYSHLAAFHGHSHIHIQYRCLY